MIETRTTRRATAPDRRAEAAGLWAAYRAGRTIENRNRLVEAYWPMVGPIARGIRRERSLADCIGVDDLVQLGAIGLMEAVERYDRGRNSSFAAYAGTRIRGAMLDGLRRWGWAGKRVCRLRAEIARAEEELAQRLGRRPADHELADELGMAPDAFARARGVADRVVVRALDGAPRFDDTDDPVEDGALVDRRSAAPWARPQRADAFRLAMGGLGRGQRLMVAMYYGAGMNKDRIARRLGCDQSWVSLLLSEARGHMARRLHGRRDELTIEA